MSLFSSHNLVDDNGLITRIKEYGITIGHVHPVPFFWHLEPFYVPVCVWMVGKTINMLSNDSAILLRKVSEEFYCPFRDFYVQGTTSRQTEILLCPVPRHRLFSRIDLIKISDELQSLMIGDQLRNCIIKGLAWFSQPGECCPCARCQSNSLGCYFSFLCLCHTFAFTSVLDRCLSCLIVTIVTWLTFLHNKGGGWNHHQRRNQQPKTPFSPYSVTPKPLREKICQPNRFKQEVHDLFDHVLGVSSKK
jgi:hypothetical protein